MKMFLELQKFMMKTGPTQGSTIHGSNTEKCKFQYVSKSELSWLIADCYVCRKAGPDIAGKTEFVSGKKFLFNLKKKALKVCNLKFYV
jgi:hypothetical protein